MDPDGPDRKVLFEILNFLDAGGKVTEAQEKLDLR
jgi:hypothetical protein